MFSFLICSSGSMRCAHSPSPFAVLANGEGRGGSAEGGASQVGFREAPPFGGVSFRECGASVPLTSRSIAEHPAGTSSPKVTEGIPVGRVSGAELQQMFLTPYESKLMPHVVPGFSWENHSVVGILSSFSMNILPSSSFFAFLPPVCCRNPGCENQNGWHRFINTFFYYNRLSNRIQLVGIRPFPCC
jgi:hypothetical protein